MPAIARQHLEQEAKSIAAHQWDLDDLLARQIKYYAELALIEACTGHMEQATDHLIRVLGLEYRQGEHSRSETRDHLARQENALARLELEAASCPQAQRWMRASRRRWEQVCQCLYRGDAEWASGLLTAAIGSWQAQLLAGTYRRTRGPRVDEYLMVR